MPGQAPLAGLREALQAYLDGKTGIRFATLAHFAEPLFNLYEIDPRASLNTDRSSRDAEELATLLSVLETARLLWGYFLLDETVSRSYFPELERCLLGCNADEEERSDFLTLLSIMEDHYFSMAATERTAARVPGYALPPFGALLENYDASSSAGESFPGIDTRYGPDALELPDALALFARPLLDNLEALDDPDAFENTLARANSYWDLAQTPRDAFEVRLDHIARSYGRTPPEMQRIKQEALEMVSRFHELFPEKNNHKP